MGSTLNAGTHAPQTLSAPITARASEPQRRDAYPRHLIETIRLRDGARLTIRPIRSSDYRLELDFIRGLSARSAYQRLLSPRKLRADEVKRLVNIDYARELALIATTEVEGDVRQVGVARYVPEADGTSCDFAIVIADAWQGRGLGEQLLRALLRAAAGAGVPALTGLTLSANDPMRALARKVGFALSRDPHDATVVQLRLSLQRVPSAVDVVER
jgi:acetyltransferase